MHDWQTLVEEQTFTTDGSGSYALSTIVTDGDYERPLTNTEWDRTNEKKLQIVTPSDWQFLKSGIISQTGIRRYARARGDNLIITPDNSGDTLVFEYVSSYYAKDSGGTKKATFTADSDEPRFKESLVELGLKAYLKTEYGLPAVEDMDRYYDSAQKLIAQEKPQKVIQPQRNIERSRFVVNIPDTGAGA